jgi:NADH:ubiquinone oxidoreductase subunit 6 (subunit J)
MLFLYRVVLSVLLLSCAAVALYAKSLVRSAVALGMGSGALAMLFFSLGASYAGGFELSVGAGLISIFFLLGISLTRSAERQPDDQT